MISASRLWAKLRPFAHASLVIAIVAGASPVLQRLPHANLSLLFMTGVIITAVRFGLWPSIYASLLSFLIYNYFFTSPVYTFNVSEEGDLATLVFFLAMASLAGNLAARTRDAIKLREKAIVRSEDLRALTQRVAGAATDRDVLQHLVNHLSSYLGCGALASAQRNGSAKVSVKSGNDKSGGDEISQEDEPEQARDDGSWTEWPIHSARAHAGKVAVNRTGLTPEETDHAHALTSQAAIALDRAILVRELAEATLVSERESLRASLLSSVSHDLRTPLASIIGSASSLLEYSESLSPENRMTLLTSTLDEAERLDRYIQNLLDMTRLDQGSLILHRDWVDIRDIVTSASNRLKLVARGFHLKCDVSSDAQLVCVHGDLFEQVIVNLLDNSAQYSDTAGEISIAVCKEGDAMVIEVADCGPGIPGEDREQVFHPFYRVNQKDVKRGTGLGLSVCRGIVAAHGGEITAHGKATGTGALFRIRLPDVRPTEATADRA